MQRRTLLFSILAVGVVAATGLTFARMSVTQRTYQPAIQFTGEKTLPLFTLTDQNGREFSLESVKGKVVLVYFGYTNCPDVCPIVMTKYAQLEKALGDKIEEVAMLLISTDPERDTPEAMSRYVSHYSNRIIALTGTREKLEKVWEAYNIPVEAEKPDEYGRYFVSHFALVIVADRNMVMRFAFTPEMEAKEYIDGVRYLLERS